MFIKRKTGAKIENALSIAVLGIIVAASIIAWIIIGKAAAIATAVLLFLLLDGFDCVWALITNQVNQRIGDKLDKMDEDNHRNGTQNNPTIR
jgi:uncharacterized membrane protein YqjE